MATERLLDGSHLPNKKFLAAGAAVVGGTVLTGAIAIGSGEVKVYTPFFDSHSSNRLQVEVPPKQDLVTLDDTLYHQMAGPAGNVPPRPPERADISSAGFNYPDELKNLYPTLDKTKFPVKDSYQLKTASGSENVVYNLTDLNVDPKAMKKLYDFGKHILTKII